MTWRLAKALVVLRDQINALSPNRSKVSDGTIGDAAHASRSSDHNPHVRDGKTGIVTAMDLTNDPAHGIVSQAIADALVASRDSRIKYVISGGKIASGAAGPSPWQWRPYKGKNPHSHHVHLSVRPEKAHYDATGAWDLSGIAVSPAKATRKPVEPRWPVLALGTKGEAVAALQRALLAAGMKVSVDADFGPKTKAALVAFQKKNGLVADGVAGPYTWAALLP